MSDLTAVLIWGAGVMAVFGIAGALIYLFWTVWDDYLSGKWDK